MNLSSKKICLRELSDKTLNSLYCTKKFSTLQIAEIYDCNPETIRRYMIKFKINRRKLHQKKYIIPKEQLEKLYNEEKLSTIEISKKYGCSPWVILSLLKYHGIKIRNANDYHLWKAPANQIKPILESSPTLSYTVGVLLGDGWVYKKRYTYFIGLEVLDKEFCKSFKEALNKLNLNPHIFESRNYWRVISISKLFYTWFKSLDFNQITKLAEKYPFDFLRGFYESEGSLSIFKSKKYYYTNFNIVIVNTNKEVIYLLGKLLCDLGFHPKIHLRETKPPRKSLWVLFLYRKSEVWRFIHLVKPCIKNGEKRLSRNI